MKSSLLRWMTSTCVVGVVVATDQLAKSWAPNVSGSQFTEVHNPGLLLGTAAIPMPLLVLGMIAVMSLFVAIIGRWSVHLGIAPAIPALIVGGFMAHIVDRARFGVVRDFIHTPWIVIDVADIAVVMGIVLLVLALALRIRSLRATSQRITFDVRTLRPLVVADDQRVGHGLAA